MSALLLPQRKLVLPTRGLVKPRRKFDLVETLEVPECMSRFMLRKPPVVSPSYDAVGAAYKGTSTAPSFAHIVGALANALVICITSTSYQPTAVKYNGVSAVYATSSTASFVNYFGVNYYVNFFTLLNPATGSHTVAITMAGSGYIAANSFSYNNVTGFGTPVGNSSSGSTSTASVTVPSATGQMVGAAFITPNAGGSFGAPSGGTSRWNAAYSSGVNYPAAYADAPGASSVTISESSPGAYWAAAGIPIL